MQRELEKLHATYHLILGVMYKMFIHEDVDAISESRMEKLKSLAKSRKANLSWTVERKDLKIDLLCYTLGKKRGKDAPEGVPTLKKNSSEHQQSIY